MRKGGALTSGVHVKAACGRPAIGWKAALPGIEHRSARAVPHCPFGGLQRPSSGAEVPSAGIGGSGTTWGGRGRYFDPRPGGASGDSSPDPDVGACAIPAAGADNTSSAIATLPSRGPMMTPRADTSRRMKSPLTVAPATNGRADSSSTAMSATHWLPGTESRGATTPTSLKRSPAVTGANGSAAGGYSPPPRARSLRVESTVFVTDALSAVSVAFAPDGALPVGANRRGAQNTAPTATAAATAKASQRVVTPRL